MGCSPATQHMGTASWHCISHDQPSRSKLRLVADFQKLEVHILTPLPTSTPYLATGKSSRLSWLVGCCVPFAGEAELLQPSHSPPL